VRFKSSSTACSFKIVNGSGTATFTTHFCSCIRVKAYYTAYTGCRFSDDTILLAGSIPLGYLFCLANQLNQASDKLIRAAAKREFSVLCQKNNQSVALFGNLKSHCPEVDYYYYYYYYY